MIKSSELNHNGLLYHHEGNHNDRGNPHAQYDPSYLHIIGSPTGTNTYQWVKACSLSVYSKNSDSNGYVKLLATNAGTASIPSDVYEIFFKVRYTKSNNTPMCEIQVSDTLKDYVMGIVSVNDTNIYTVDLYLKNAKSWGSFNVKEMASSIMGFITKTYGDDAGSTWQASLPVGTQITPSYIPYVETMNYTTSNNGTTGNQYALIGTVNISSQYKQSVVMLNIMGGVAGQTSNTQRAMLYFRVRQQSAMASPPVVEAVLVGYTNFKKSDIVAVITSNTGSLTTVQLYVKIKATYEQMLVKPIHDPQTVDGNVPIVLSNKATLVTSLPAGTQVNAVYDDVVLTSTNGTDYKLVVSDAGALSTVAY